MEDENLETVGNAEVKIEERSRRTTTELKSQKVSTVSKTSPVINIVSYPPQVEVGCRLKFYSSGQGRL